MTNCVYNTDPNWFYFLKENGYISNLNFWRKDHRRLKLSSGDYFYFKLRGHKYIAGRAQFVKQIDLTIEEAWQQYGERNGVPSLSLLEQKVTDLFKETYSKTSKLNCLILNNAEWLPETDYYSVSQDFYPSNILGAKYYSDSEIEIVASLFNSGANPTINYADKKFLENRIKFSKHRLRERDSNLVKLVKNSRSWECEICGVLFEDKYGIAYIEAHHKVPLSNIDSVVHSDMTDIALLCPNCHKAVHRVMDNFPSKQYKQIKKELQVNLSRTL